METMNNLHDVPEKKERIDAAVYKIKLGLISCVSQEPKCTVSKIQGALFSSLLGNNEGN